MRVRSEHNFWILVAPALAALTVATRWPFRSRWLFSWDSANFAFAVERIDVAAHRPHPPGYLAYVLVARGLLPLTGDVNAAFVVWNIIACALIAIVMFRFAWHAESDRPRTMAAGAAAIVLCSPLLWFYSEVAEIYSSELLVTLLVGYAAWRAMQGATNALYACAGALCVAVVFKITAALLMLPLVMYAWWLAPPGQRARTGAALAGGLVLAAGALLIATPNLPHLIWTQFAESVASSRVLDVAAADPLERLGRNLRATLAALVGMIGLVNVGALLVWLVRDRRLPRAIDGRTALFWVTPWLALCVLVHIAKPGYLLPILPIVTLVLAGFYARQRTVVYASMVAFQAAINVAHFAWVNPIPESVRGGASPYRSKTLIQRLASDLQPLTVPTAATIHDADAGVARLVAVVQEQCSTQAPIIVAEATPVDARRAMWYVPRALVVHTIAEKPTFTGVHGNIRPAGNLSVPLSANCPLIWLSPPEAQRPAALPLNAVVVPGVGFLIGSGTLHVTPGQISLRPAPRS